MVRFRSGFQARIEVGNFVACLGKSAVVGYDESDADGQHYCEHYYNPEVEVQSFVAPGYGGGC